MIKHDHILSYSKFDLQTLKFLLNEKLISGSIKITQSEKFEFSYEF